MPPTYCTTTETVVVCAEPLLGVAVTVTVYVPAVVPAWVPGNGVPELPQLTAVRTTTASNAVSGTRLQRLSRLVATIKSKPIKAVASPAKGNPRPEGRLDGRTKTPEAAVVLQVIVALPEVFDEVSAIMLLGENALHEGGLTAPLGEPVTAALNVTFSLEPLGPETVIAQVPD